MSAHGRSRFFPNALALVVQTCAGTLLTFVQIKILSNFLDQSTFGLFASLRGFVLLIGLLAANGFPQLLVRYLPIHEAAGAPRRVLGLVWRCLLTAGVLVMALAAIAYGLRGQLFGFMDEGAISRGLITWMMVTALAVALRHVLYGALHGLRQMGVQVAVELTTSLVTVVWLFVVRDSLSVVAVFKILGIVHTGSLLVGLPTFAWLAARVDREGEPARAADPAPSYRNYLLWAIAVSLVATAFTDVDRFVIAQVLPLELLALFHVSARVARATNRLLAASNIAFQPEITRLLVENRRSDVGSIGTLFLKVNVTVAVLVAFGLGCFARDIILIATRSDYLGAVPLLVLLAASIPLTAATAPLTTVMKAGDQIRHALGVDLAWAVVYIALLLALSPTFGLIGTGVATVIACLAQLALALRWSTLSVSAQMCLRVIAKAIAASSLALLPLFAIMVFSPDGVWNLVIKLILYIVGCGVALRLVQVLHVFDDDERDFLETLLRHRGVGWLARAIR